MFPRYGRYSPQVLQHHLIQNALPNVVACAGFAIFFIGAAGEVVVAGRHGMCPVQHHIEAAVGAEHKAGVLVLLIHIGSSALVLSYPLHNVPNFLCNESGMGILKHQAFFSGMLHPPFVLVGLGAVFHVDGVAQIDFVFQHIGYGIPRPVIWALGIQSRMSHTVLGIGVHGGCQHLFFFQDSGDLAGAVATGAHGEDPADDGRRFFIYRQLLCILVLDVTVGRSGSQPFSAFRLGFQHRPDFPAGVPNKPLVEQIFERHEVVALAAVSVHIVIDGDVANAEHGEAFLNVEAGMELISAEAAEILGDNDPDFTVLHIGNHLLERGPLEIAAGETIIHIEAGIREMVVFGKLLQDIFLRRDLSRVFSS